MKRNYRVDNIRFLLIFLVVFAHMLELISGKTSDMLYRLIYTFHMGAFLFLTGYFSAYKPGKIIFSLVWPYFLFQTFYLLFYGYVIREAETVELSYTTPHWLLWYLMVTVFYYLLIPLLNRDNPTERLLVFGVTIVASLMAGLDDSVGYYLSLSRFLCYLLFLQLDIMLGMG